MSQNTAFAPVYSIACAVAVCVIAGTIISSPCLNPAAIQDKCSPAVQLETVKAYLELVYFLNFSSNNFVYLPCVSHPLLIILLISDRQLFDIFFLENFIFIYILF